MLSLLNHHRHRHRQSATILASLLLLCCWDLPGAASRSSGIIGGVAGRISHHAATATATATATTRKLSPFAISDLRGGSSTAAAQEADEDEDEDEGDDKGEDAEGLDITQHPEFKSLQSYRMKQQILLQLRATFLSEALARRGLPLATLREVATPEGASPPQPVDWDCAMATEENPKSCLFSFDAQPNTKVVAPLGSTDWIGLSTLNRLRRTDPTKVEPMWHMKHAILESWFDPESEYSLLQHVGVQGFLLNALLQGYRLQLALLLTLGVATILFMPVLEYFANRLLVSGLLWNTWHQWYRFVHAALPLKLFLGQMILKVFTNAFDKLVTSVKDQLVELENEILERSIPLTVGVPDRMPPSQLQEDVMDEELSALLFGDDGDDDEEDAEDYDDDDVEDSDNE
jgi:hypothetical protein